MDGFQKKIPSNYGGYKASQRKNWTTVYLLYALNGALSEPHSSCWHTLVLACRLLNFRQPSLFLQFTNITKNSSVSYNLTDSVWCDSSQVVLPKSYKLLHFDSEDFLLLSSSYSVMYPGKDIQVAALGECSRRFGSVMLAGSKTECRVFKSARVMATWVTQNGKIATRANLRRGYVKFYFVH